MNNSIEIIAENAQGFEGNPELAMQLLRAAAATGANAAKYQLVYADELCTPDYKFYKQSASLEMDDEFWFKLKQYSISLNIELIFDIFGEKSLNVAENLKSETVMMHATDITNIPLLKLINKGQIKRVILGAGGAHLNEIENALDVLKEKNICIMLGFQGYPTPDEHNQISRINYLKEWLIHRYDNVSVGFSDHSLPESSLITSLAAMALGAGATSFEKHLTISKIMEYEDYESAIGPDEFYNYVRDLKMCYEAYGEVKGFEDFGMYESEIGYRKFIRRHAVTSEAIVEGTEISAKHFVFKRSSLVNPITDIKSLIGKKALRNLDKNQPVTAIDFT
jgi:sialic acid synthase SpsE